MFLEPEILDVANVMQNAKNIADFKERVNTIPPNADRLDF